MKKLLLCLALLFLTLEVSSAATNYFCLAAPAKTALDAIIVSNPSEIVTIEGANSYIYSSVRGESDYFVIPSTNAHHGRVLRMQPFTTSDWRPWYGVEETNVLFFDIISGESFSAPLFTETPPEGKQHRATISVDGVSVYVLVRYSLSPRYPYVNLTWGALSEFGNTGIDSDVHACPPPVEPIPTNSFVATNFFRNQGGGYAVVFLLQHSLHAQQNLQSSSNLVSWETIPRKDLLISIDGRKLFHETDSDSQKFFRLIW